MNHAVLYVRDVARTTDFYRDLLGFRVKVAIPGQAAFLQAPASTNDHDLGLFVITDDQQFVAIENLVSNLARCFLQLLDVGADRQRVIHQQHDASRGRIARQVLDVLLHVVVKDRQLF